MRIKPTNLNPNLQGTSKIGSIRASLPQMLEFYRRSGGKEEFIQYREAGTDVRYLLTFFVDGSLITVYLYRNNGEGASEESQDQLLWSVGGRSHSLLHVPGAIAKQIRIQEGITPPVGYLFSTSPLF